MTKMNKNQLWYFLQDDTGEAVIYATVKDGKMKLYQKMSSDTLKLIANDM